MRAFLLKLGAGEKGIAAVEFALIAPPFLGLIMGACDIGHTLYMQAVLNGVAQKAARDSSLATGTEAAHQALIETRVRNEIRKLNQSIPDSDIVISRENYQDFTKAQAAQPEDVSGDGICSPGENWIDRNFNGVYDKKGGTTGQGGAKDVVVFTVSVSYPRLFPVARLIGMPGTVALKSTAVLANQPYSDQVIKSGALTPKPCA